MEVRKMNVSFGKSGSGSISPKIALSYIWLKQMGITPIEREIEVTFDEEKEEIVIRKKVNK